MLGLKWVGQMGISTCSSVESSINCRLDIPSSMIHHGLQEDSLLHYGLSHGLQGNLCSGTSSPSFFTDLGVYRVVSHLFFLLDAVLQQFFSLFLNVVTKVPPPFLMGLDLPVVGPSWSQLALALLDTGEGSSRSHRCSTPTTKTLPCKPNMRYLFATSP